MRFCGSLYAFPNPFSEVALSGAPHTHTLFQRTVWNVHLHDSCSHTFGIAIRYRPHFCVQDRTIQRSVRI